MSELSALQFFIDNITIEPMRNWNEIITKAIELEKQQHGKTWDSAIEAYEARGHVKERAICDFDEYFDSHYG